MIFINLPAGPREFFTFLRKITSGTGQFLQFRQEFVCALSVFFRRDHELGICLREPQGHANLLLFDCLWFLFNRLDNRPAFF